MSDVFLLLAQRLQAAVFRRNATLGQSQAPGPSNFLENLPFGNSRLQHDSSLDQEPQSTEAAPDVESGQVPYAQDDEQNLDQYSEVPIDEEAQLEAERTARNQRYVSFEPEAEEDYTIGPPRFIFADDGVRDCAALLMTYDLSQRIKKAARLQRVYAQEELFCKEQTKQLRVFERKLKREISSQKIKLRAAGEDPDKTAESLQNTIETLEMMAKSKASERELLEARLQTRATFLREAQAEMMADLDEAFVAAQLLDPVAEETIPVEQLDLQEEYVKFQAEQQQQQQPDETSVAIASPLDTSRDYLTAEIPAPTPEEQAAIDVTEAFRAARERLYEAQAQFDNKKENQKQDEQQNEQAWLHGEVGNDTTPEAFDLRWVQIIQEMTRELIEAEEALLQARMAAAQAGIDLMADDQSECFVDDPNDGREGLGYDVSDEDRVWLLERDRQDIRLNAWLESVSAEDDAESMPAAEVDEWETEEVEIGDSVSAVAEAPYRRKIDVWQQVCCSLSRENS